LVDIQIIKNKKDWAEGFATTYHAYAKNRISPFCTHFGICGGCQWQMLPYADQLVYKQKQVRDQLERIGKVAFPEPLPIVGAQVTTGYRNKLEYTFSNKRYLLQEELRDEQVTPVQDVAGFHVKGIFDKIIDIDRCFLQDEPTNRLRKAVKSWGIENSVPFYDIKMQRGWLRNMQVRICRTGEIMINIIFGYEDEQKRTELLDHIMQHFPEITTLLYTANPKKNDSLTGLTPQIFHGKGFILESLGGFYFKIGAKSFFQTNTQQAERLYEITRDFAELSGKEIVYDLYCGTGSIGIFVSRHSKKVVGVELVEEAVADARENARLNNIEHAHFFSGDVIDICHDEFFDREGRPDVIIVDPPRAGLHEKLVRKIIAMGAPRVVYVSCNPATQARDLRLLDEKYTLTKVQPVDMFPHTHHIENVVQLKLKN
jgi:23S rRNA (uracil1939-C5)-methyltransferase